MAHEIESFMYNGQRVKPWHSLGVSIDGTFSVVEALLKGSLDWVVEKQPIYLKGDVLIPDKWATVRTRDNSPLGVVGNQYTPIQNADAFNVVDEIISKGSANFETAGSLRGGKFVFLTAKIPNDSDREKYLVFVNSHDGTLPITMLTTCVEVVCMNTLNLALKNASNKMTVKHTTTAEERLKEAERVFSTALQYFDELYRHIDDLKAVKMDSSQTKIYVESLFPKPVKDDKAISYSEFMNGASILKEKVPVLSARRENQIAKVMSLCDGEAKLEPKYFGTAYGNFQSAVEFSDWFSGSRGKDTDRRAENKLSSIWFGSGAEFKQSAYDKLIKQIN
jgi:phage/plasmid-like protein (TIGR03299 family)